MLAQKASTFKPKHHGTKLEEDVHRAGQQETCTANGGECRANLGFERNKVSQVRMANGAWHLESLFFGACKMKDPGKRQPTQFRH